MYDDSLGGTPTMKPTKNENKTDKMNETNQVHETESLMSSAVDETINILFFKKRTPGG